MLKDKIEKHLLEVQKPSRYIGGEVGSVIKDKSKGTFGLHSASRTLMTSECPTWE